jgi:hypothetical protein
MRLRTAAATAFMSGIGGWQGMDAGTPKWRVGDPSGDHIAFDGTDITINAPINFPGALVANADVGAELVRSDVDRTAPNATELTAYTFTVRGTGTITVVVRARADASSVGGQHVRVERNGTTIVGSSALPADNTYAEYTFADISVTSLDDVFTVILQGSQDEFNSYQADADWMSVRARLQLGSVS